MRVSMGTFILGALALTAATVTAGCGDDGGGSGAGEADQGATTSSGAPSTGSSATPSGTASSSSGGDGGDGGSGDGGTTHGGNGQGGDGGSGDGGSRPTEMEVVAVFDPAAFDVPEGLALRGDDAIVGFALTGAIESIAASDGTRSDFATLPPPPPNTSFLTGLSFAPDGDLVAALVSFTSDAVPGLYRVGPGGGAAELWATHPDVIFPNGMAWDEGGLLYFTDSVAGGVFTADDEGVVTPWASDDLLGGDPTVCGGSEGDVAVGANGIVWTDGAVYVAGSDHGVVLRFPIDDEGAAGAAEIVAGPDCDALAGIDGLARADDGTFVGAVNRADRIVRIDPASGDVTTIAEGAPLDFPASVAFEEGGSILVTSFALDGILAGGEAAPALVRVIPGS